MDATTGITLPARLLWLTFVESFAAVLLERAFYFYTHDALHFDDSRNLWLAFLFGAFYIGGALASHPVAERVGERRVLIASIAALLFLHLLLTSSPTSSVLIPAFVSVGFLQGIKWPVIESFISAGRAPSELARVLGRFNTAWASAVPLALLGSGPLIASSFPRSLFAAAAGLNALAFALSLPLSARPAHLEVTTEHSELPASRRLGGLLISARWMLILSYALLFLLAPLIPDVFTRLRLSVSEATAAYGLLDFVRVLTFAALGALTGWRARRWPVLACMLLLPASFAMMFLADALWVILLGELAFGLASGFFYTAALYYAQLLKNASVDAGGAHEGLIGLGFALGPLAGIIGHALSQQLGGFATAVFVAILPVAMLCTVFALRALTRIRADT